MPKIPKTGSVVLQDLRQHFPGRVDFRTFLLLEIFYWKFYWPGMRDHDINPALRQQLQIIGTNDFLREPVPALKKTAARYHLPQRIGLANNRSWIIFMD